MSASTFRDEMLLCERCGIAFLWSSEEQRHATRQGNSRELPRLCPGCRHLLPPPGFRRGLVKWYSPRRRYGFVVSDDGTELFTHRSHFVSGLGTLHSGDLVEFRVLEEARGPVAVDVRLLQRSAGSRL